MSKKKISFGVLIGGLSLAIDSLSGLIIYPLLLKYCTKEVAGLWIFYTSFTVVISLGQAGLAPIVMRKAAEAKVSGKKDDFANFLLLILKSYKIVTALVFLICIVLYFSYIHWVLVKNPELFFAGIVAWIFFVAGNSLRMYFVKNIHIINGLGEVGWDKLVQIGVSIFTIIGYFLVLSLGGSLIGLSAVFLIASVIYGFGSKFLLIKFIPIDLISIKGKVLRSDLYSLFSTGGKILILNMVSIIVMNKDIYLVERFIGLSILPLFSALNRIQSMIMAISMMIPSMIFPFISQSYAQQDFKKSYKLYWQGVIFSMLVAILMSLMLLLFANKLIPLWLGEGNYLGNGIFGLLILFALLSIHHNAHASAIISTGANYFMWPAIINALLSIPFSIIGIKYFGIEGMIIGNVIATVIPSGYVVLYSVRFFISLKRIRV